MENPNLPDSLSYNGKTYIVRWQTREVSSYYEILSTEDGNSQLYRYRYGQYPEFVLSELSPEKITPEIMKVPETNQWALWLFESPEGKKIFDILALRWHAPEITNECVIKVKKLFQIYAKEYNLPFPDDVGTVRVNMERIQENGVYYFQLTIHYPEEWTEDNFLAGVYNSGSRSVANPIEKTQLDTKNILSIQ